MSQTMAVAEEDRDGSVLGVCVAILQGLGGHIHGEYVLHAVARMEPEAVRTVQCTLPACMVHTVPAVLAAALSNGHHTIVQHVSAALPDAPPSGLRLTVSTANPPLDLVVFPHGHVSPLGDAPHPIFDWNLMVLSPERLYIRRPLRQPLRDQAGTTVPVQPAGRLARALERCRKGRFCLTDCAALRDPDSQSDVHAGAMLAASEYVAAGWHMDDAIAGCNGWVVSNWRRLQSDPASVRLGGPCPPGEATPPTTHAVCPICFAAFKSDDVVVNLPCTHNFHVDCGGSGGGLAVWVRSGHSTCPCCRAPVFRAMAEVM